MFRRRTDQVYSTLQQVQRRITEQNQGDVFPDISAPQPASSEASPPPSPYRDRGATGSVGLAPRGASAVLSPPPPALQPRTEAITARAPSVLMVSPQLAMFLAILWFGTVALAYTIGNSQGKHAPNSPGAGQAQGKAGDREPDFEQTPTQAQAPVQPAAAARTQTGTWILVLNSVPKATPQAEQQFAATAQNLNAAAAKVAEKDSRYRPWFGTRRSTGGGLQLIFGVVNGQYGVDQDSFADLYRDLESTNFYKGMRWINLSQSQKP